MPGEKVKKGEVIADGPSVDKGELALGQNMLVSFMSWDGYNYDDAVILSERVVQDDRFTTIHLEHLTIDVRDTKLGPEIVTSDIPNVSEEKLKNLDAEGIIRVGAEVKSGDILVGKITPKGRNGIVGRRKVAPRNLRRKGARGTRQLALLGARRKGARWST